MAASESDQVTVKAVRPFEGEEGYKDEASAPFKVSRRRAAELRANGLVQDDADRPSAKQAPVPANKMDPAPTNKAKSDAGRAEKA